MLCVLHTTTYHKIPVHRATPRADLGCLTDRITGDRPGFKKSDSELARWTDRDRELAGQVMPVMIA